MDKESALTTIFANTKRRKRTKDLLTIAENFQYLLSVYGTQEAVAQNTGLSREMVREFLQILTLPDYVKDQIKIRKIDTIDAAYRLSTVKDERTLRTIFDNLSSLQTHDLRDVISTTEETRLSVDEAKQAVLEAKPKNLHVFVIDFDEEKYRKLTDIAKRHNCSPADLIKTVMDEWLDHKEEDAQHLAMRIHPKWY